MSLGLLFPGQGVQHADMLPWLEADPLAAPVLKTMADVLGVDWRERLTDDTWACGNLVAQTLITGVSLAAWATLAPQLPAPVVVAGYSVGELAAYSAAGVFDAEAALMLAQRRAHAMDRCASGGSHGLMSVASGAFRPDIAALCAQFDLAVAILINVDHVILGGSLDALRAAAKELSACGAGSTLLRVRLASHTPTMAAAAREFAGIVEPMVWQRGGCFIANNVDGSTRRDVRPLKHALASQIDHTVRWDQCMDSLAERRPRCVLEVGPGTSLARMLAVHSPDLPVRSIDEFRSAAAAIAWVRSRLA